MVIFCLLLPLLFKSEGVAQDLARSPLSVPETKALNLVAIWVFFHEITPPKICLCRSLSLLFILKHRSAKGLRPPFRRSAYFACLASSWVTDRWHLSLFSAPSPLFLDGLIPKLPGFDPACLLLPPRRHLPTFSCPPFPPC